MLTQERFSIAPSTGKNLVEDMQELTQTQEGADVDKERACTRNSLFLSTNQKTVHLYRHMEELVSYNNRQDSASSVLAHDLHVPHTLSYQVCEKEGEGEHIVSSRHTSIYVYNLPEISRGGGGEQQ